MLDGVEEADPVLQVGPVALDFDDPLIELRFEVLEGVVDADDELAVPVWKSPQKSVSRPKNECRSEAPQTHVINSATREGADNTSPSTSAIDRGGTGVWISQFG